MAVGLVSFFALFLGNFPYPVSIDFVSRLHAVIAHFGVLSFLPVV